MIEKSFFSGRWTWLSRIHQGWLLWSRQYVHELPRILIARLQYWRRLRVIREESTRRKLRVLFLVSNLSKWKMQSLFDAMRASEVFDPFMVVIIQDTEWRLSDKEKKDMIHSLCSYFLERGMRTFVGYDADNQESVPLDKFNPDLVFYQQPYSLAVGHRPSDVCKLALTCYVPYYVQDYGSFNFDCGLFFHRMMWRYFTLNEDWANEFTRYQGALCRAGAIKGMGHPMLDMLQNDKSSGNDRPLVVYAPHWTCGHVGWRVSTFLEVGEKMLNLAKQHQEISWVFKPHPTLRQTLIDYKYMTMDEIDAYYSAWEHVGTVCFNGPYVELFEKSSAMITDCGSFLVEYASTKKPIIHLISKNPAVSPHRIANKLFSTYYQARSWDEFLNLFEDVIIKKKDFKRDERLSAVRELNLLDRNAGRRIVDYLCAEFCGERK